MKITIFLSILMISFLINAEHETDTGVNDAQEEQVNELGVETDNAS